MSQVRLAWTDDVKSDPMLLLVKPATTRALTVDRGRRRREAGKHGSVQLLLVTPAGSVRRDGHR